MSTNHWLSSTTLESETVALIPLETEHAADLVAAATDGHLWDLWFTGVPSKHTIQDYLAFALGERDAGRALPFAVYHKRDQQIIGSTRFCNACSENKRVEIGYTWYAKSYQRSSVNSECKLLLLTHAFEHLSAIAVEFRTHWHNQTSRTAIARLGAKQDGVLRNHTVDPDGCYRDTVVFSIINHEWPVVQKSLKYALAVH